MTDSLKFEVECDKEKYDEERRDKSVKKVTFGVRSHTPKPIK